MTFRDTSMSVFAVAPSSVDGNAAAMVQHLTAAVADHRGLIDLPAIAVMADSLAGIPFWTSFGRSVGTVQSWLALTAGAPLEIGQRVNAISQLAHRDDDYGITTIKMNNDDGHVSCAGVSRSVRVGRPSEAPADVSPADPRPEFVPGPGAPPLPPPINPDFDGVEIMSAITSGRISAGPLCELLCAAIDPGADRMGLTVLPQPWMANVLGAMHGGVVAAIIGQACSLAGQLHTRPGQSYRVADLSVDFFRSPPVDDGALTVATGTERMGRRLGTVSAIMTGPGGRLLARAVANLRYG